MTEETIDLQTLIDLSRLVKYPFSTLCRPTKEVEDVKAPYVELLVKRLVEEMRFRDGVGIAANQLGFPEKICICWFNERTEVDIQVMINPVIINSGGPMVPQTEGCLSCPGVGGTVRRSDWVYVQWTDMDGFMDWERFDGMNARIVQHELDHLNGITIVDKFNQVDKLANRRAIEALKIDAGELPERLARRGYALRG